MVTFIWILQIISAIFSIILVLLHSPKGDGIAGIGGASQLFTSQKGLIKLRQFLREFLLYAHSFSDLAS